MHDIALPQHSKGMLQKVRTYVHTRTKTPDTHTHTHVYSGPAHPGYTDGHGIRVPICRHLHHLITQGLSVTGDSQHPLPHFMQ